MTLSNSPLNSKAPGIAELRPPMWISVDNDAASI